VEEREGGVREGEGRRQTAAVVSEGRSTNLVEEGRQWEGSRGEGDTREEQCCQKGGA
jgi:hypothetical protein